jgi:arsenate reductase (thioredoxin)
MIKILFVCVENSCRSQMAEGFARLLGDGVVAAFSAGSRPSGIVNPKAVEAMKEIGVDISGNRSKGFKDVGVDKFDYVVTMGCGDVCPFVPGKTHLDWKIEDPKGKDGAFFRRVRDSIGEEVRQLIQQAVRGRIRRIRDGTAS